ncbi:hypothetical protein ABIC61_002498 [Curtobacterium sp. 1544]
MDLWQPAERFRRDFIMWARCPQQYAEEEPRRLKVGTEEPQVG